MPANRFFIDTPLTEHTEVTLTDPDELHHLRVLRAHEGTPIELVNGKHTLATAHITHIEKRSATAHIDTVETHPPQGTPITLAIPLTQQSKLDLIIEKGCELGATAFWIYPADNSEKKHLTENQHRRLHHLIISAMKQCGRLDLPTLTLKSPLHTWPPFEGRTLFGDTRPDARALTPENTPTLIITGPEKGLSPAELTTLETTLKATPVTLHYNTLRMETAPLVALTLLTTTQAIS